MPDDEFLNAINAKPSQKVLPIFFLVDMSGSMYGNRIAAVNAAMDQLWPELKALQDKETLLDIQVRVITFKSDNESKERIEWYVGSINKGVGAASFQWSAIPTDAPYGFTPTDGAIKELLKCVGDSVYKENVGKRFAIPFMMLLSDGESTDTDAYRKAVLELQSSKIGQKAIMCAVGIETTNNPDAVAELQLFGRNGFKDCSDLSLTDLAKLVSTATFKSIKLTTDANNVQSSVHDVNVFDDDTF